MDTAAAANFTLATNAAFEFFTTSATAIHNDYIDASANGSGIDIRTGLGNDTIIGSEYAGAIVNGGNDLLDGGAGDDSIVGGAGNDRIYGREGVDQLSGGDGDDVIYFDSLDTVVEGGAGSDFANAQLSGAGVDFDMAARSFERTSGSNFGDTIRGGVGSDSISGLSGDDSIVGGGGADVIDGGDGADTITGGAGNDSIIGNLGLDQVILSGNFSEYSFASIAAGSTSNGIKGLAGIQLTHATDGIDRIANISDLLIFADRQAYINQNNLTEAVNDTATVAEDATLNAASVLDNDFDADVAFGRQTLSNLTVSLVSGPANAASFTLNSNGTYSYQGTGNYSGSDSFTYQISDTFGNSNIATVNLTITEVNDAPVATDDSLSSVAEDSGMRVISIASLLGNDSAGPANESAQTLTITALSNIVGGTAVINGTNIEFTPTSNFNGTASFDYTVQDNGTTNGVSDPKTDTGSESFTITAVNDAPTLSDVGNAATYSGAAVVIDSSVTIADIDDTNMESATVSITANFNAGDTLNFTNQNGITGTYNGTTGVLSLSGSATRANYETALESITFSTSSGVTATRTVTFLVNDGDANSNSGAATVAVNVADPNDNDNINIGNTNSLGVAVPSGALIDTTGTNSISGSGGGPGGAGTYYGWAGNDTIVASPGNDTIFGGSGNDSITAGQGTDLIYGGSGNDTIDGGSTADVIVGGYGADSLTGSGADDIFRYFSIQDSTATAFDTISDFGKSGGSVDKIDLAAIDANTALAGDQAFAFVATQTGSVVANSITWQQSGGNTTIRGDVNGDTVADFVIVLTGNIALASTDFNTL
jgi:Ca2+-binding RTX toxin-like protein